MKKSNIHRKMTFEDRFIRKWWKRNHSYWNEVRRDKRASRRKFRHMKIEDWEVIADEEAVSENIDG